MTMWNDGAREVDMEAYQRILESLRELADGQQTALSRLASGMQWVLGNEIATRRLLADEVYGVPDQWLDEVLRVRLGESGS